jgi:hypothetical protein
MEHCVRISGIAENIKLYGVLLSFLPFIEWIKKT